MKYRRAARGFVIVVHLALFGILLVGPARIVVHFAPALNDLALATRCLPLCPGSSPIEVLGGIVWVVMLCAWVGIVVGQVRLVTWRPTKRRIGLLAGADLAWVTAGFALVRVATDPDALLDTLLEQVRLYGLWMVAAGAIAAASCLALRPFQAMEPAPSPRLG